MSRARFCLLLAPLFFCLVVAGSLPAKDGSHSLYAAIIVKQVDAKTRAKTSPNELLRSFG